MRVIVLWSRWLVTAVLVTIVADSRGLIAQQPQSPPPDVPAVKETVVVVGVTPVDGVGVDRDRIPSNVQTLSDDALTRTGGVLAVEQLSLAAASVHLNDATTNPVQPDVQYRGFAASPLLGLPQGLAVYQNGVRLNEPFGDTVNWDLLPGQAIAGISLMPGSNPLFGLNALGGAISLRTKTGLSHPGHSLGLSGGSFGRYLVEGASGGGAGRLSYFVAGTALSENGWRDFSASRLRQLFGDVGYRGDRTTLHATLTSGHNRLIGNGPAPIELLEEDRSAVFTYPDETRTRITLLTLNARQARGAWGTVEGSLYVRRASVGTLNGDDSAYDECEDEASRTFLCGDEGEGDPLVDQFGDFIRVDDDDDELNGTDNTSQTTSLGSGGALQATVVRPLAGRANHFVTGVSFDAGRSRYDADTEIARLTDARGTVGTGLFDTDARVGLRTIVRHSSAYAANFHTLATRLTLMGAVRVNHSVVQLRDQIGDDLTGDHTFARVNPAVGLTYAIADGPTVFGSYSVSSRVPAPSELSCADEDDPCRLPNAFVSDPPLEQVVARTWEGGVRGRQGGVAWNASLFRTTNRDDIMFISSGPLTNTGHFENVGDTRRQGLELAAASSGAVQWSVAYSFLRAQFDSPLVVSSPNHPEAADGELIVDRGRRIPSVPQHHLKVNASGRIRQLTLTGMLTSTSSQYLRGDEANLLPVLEGFSLVGLRIGYDVTPAFRMTMRVTNLLGATYATFGVLGEPDEVLGDDYEDPRFLSPGAPRAAWFGVEWSLP